mgnify:CR=1 FL=1|jgi:quercetin dioxygenase-like cupin family protein
MYRRISLICLVSGLICGAAGAQPSQTGVLHLTSAQIAERVSQPPATPGATVTSIISQQANYNTLVATRTADGSVERHDHWTDIMSILSGEVSVIVGGTQAGETVGPNGESHGGTQSGGTTIVLHAGDYLEIPAGVPHRMIQPKDNFRYLVVKVKGP